MARNRKSAAPAQAVAEATPDTAPAMPPMPSEADGTHAGRLASARGATAVEGPQANEAAERKPEYAPDPNEKIRVSLSDVRGGPSMQLLRSHKYNQMQIKFDGEQPDDRYLAKLKENGWRDRTQEEGIFTKQIDRNAKWQSVDKMEQEFKDLANEIRRDRKLGPVLEIGA